MKKKIEKLLSIFVLMIALFLGTTSVHSEEVTFNYEFQRSGQKLTVDRSKLIIDDSLNDKLESIDITLPKDVRLLVDTPSGWRKMESSGSVTYILNNNRQLDVIQNFLGSLVFEVNTETSVQIGINLNTTRVVPRNHEDGTTHYYKFVEGNYDWYTSYNLAKQETYNGLTGYLMTVTSPEENAFITSSLEIRPGWLGGTRHKNKDKTKINDMDSVIGNYKEYDYSEDEWYWATGPEAGQVFSKGKTGNVTIPGVYSKWSAGEPNNAMGLSGEPADSEEAALQWGIDVYNGTWNDLSPTFTFSPRWIQGYFVEFSEYNGQTIKPEVNKGASFVASVPQKVSLKYYDTEFNELPVKEFVLDEDLAIGKSYSFLGQLPDIPGYEIDLSKSAELSGTITDRVINAKAVYRKRNISADADAEIKLLENSGTINFVDIPTNADIVFEDVTINGLDQKVGEKSRESFIKVQDSRKNKTKGWEVSSQYKDDGFTKHNFKVDFNPVSTNKLTLIPATLSDSSQSFIINAGNNTDSDFEIKLQPQLTIPGSYNTLGQQNTLIEWLLIPEV